jgi:hypothetical protein
MIANTMETSSSPQTDPAPASAGQASTSKSSSKRSGRRPAKKALAPRAGAPDLVQITGGAITELDEEATAAQALIDLEIRRSMREARLRQSLRVQQSEQQPAATSEVPRAGAPGGSNTGAVSPHLANPDVEENEERDESTDEAIESAQAVAPEPTIAAQTISQHLGLMAQQLTAAHRVIGRVSAERDALRQQIADLQGIPVEDVMIASLATSGELDKDLRVGASGEEEAEQKPSRLAKLNYFGGEDIALMRRRRQTFVLGLIAILLVGALYARQIGWSMPEDVSRESLAALPVLGNFMYVFLAGWMLFRVVKVSSRGVRWVFPSEDRRRRRR